MPIASSSRNHGKPETKAGLKLPEVPRLDILSASHSGNLGLVKFALSYYRPIVPAGSINGLNNNYNNNNGASNVLLPPSIVNAISLSCSPGVGGGLGNGLGPGATAALYPDLNTPTDASGVLPLHAACAGGNEVVVEWLIGRGADVNGPSAPRRFDKDKSKSIYNVVNPGSTPLHFASANGHAHIIALLLDRGANPALSDKAGLTPEMLARAGGWVECERRLKAWREGREGDLPPVGGRRSDGTGSVGGKGGNKSVGNGNGVGAERERDEGELRSRWFDPDTPPPPPPRRDRSTSPSPSPLSLAHPNPNASVPTSTRLKVKRSIDSAFHLIKAGAGGHHLHLHGHGHGHNHHSHSHSGSRDASANPGVDIHSSVNGNVNGNASANTSSNATPTSNTHPQNQNQPQTPTSYLSLSPPASATRDGFPHVHGHGQQQQYNAYPYPYSTPSQTQHHGQVQPQPQIYDQSRRPSLPHLPDLPIRLPKPSTNGNSDSKLSVVRPLRRCGSTSAAGVGAGANGWGSGLRANSFSAGSDGPGAGASANTNGNSGMAPEKASSSTPTLSTKRSLLKMRIFRSKANSNGNSSSTSNANLNGNSNLNGYSNGPGLTLEEPNQSPSPSPSPSPSSYYASRPSEGRVKGRGVGRNGVNGGAGAGGGIGEGGISDEDEDLDVDVDVFAPNPVFVTRPDSGLNSGVGVDVNPSPHIVDHELLVESGDPMTPTTPTSAVELHRAYSIERMRRVAQSQSQGQGHPQSHSQSHSPSPSQSQSQIQTTTKAPASSSPLSNGHLRSTSGSTSPRARSRMDSLGHGPASFFARFTHSHSHSGSGSASPSGSPTANGKLRASQSVSSLRSEVGVGVGSGYGSGTGASSGLPRHGHGHGQSRSQGIVLGPGQVVSGKSDILIAGTEGERRSEDLKRGGDGDDAGALGLHIPESAPPGCTEFEFGTVSEDLKRQKVEEGAGGTVNGAGAMDQEVKSNVDMAQNGDDRKVENDGDDDVPHTASTAEFPARFQQSDVPEQALPSQTTLDTTSVQTNAQTPPQPTSGYGSSRHNVPRHLQLHLVHSNTHPQPGSNGYDRRSGGAVEVINRDTANGRGRGDSVSSVGSEWSYGKGNSSNNIQSSLAHPPAKSTYAYNPHHAHSPNSSTSSLSSSSLSPSAHVNHPIESLENPILLASKGQLTLDFHTIGNLAAASALKHSAEREILNMARAKEERRKEREREKKRDMTSGVSAEAVEGVLGGGEPVEDVGALIGKVDEGEDEDESAVPLSAQLAAYGEILQLEKRIGKVERQREMWGRESDEDLPSQSQSNSAKPMGISTSSFSRDRERDRGEKDGGGSSVSSSFSARHDTFAERTPSPRMAVMGMTRPPHAAAIQIQQQRERAKRTKIRRPHTSEGKTSASSPLSDLSFTTSSTSTVWNSSTNTTANVPKQVPANAYAHGYTHGQTRSQSSMRGFDSPAVNNNTHLADIQIIETKATPVGPGGLGPVLSSSSSPPRYLPSDSPVVVSPVETNGLGHTVNFGGAPLVRVSTVPLGAGTTTIPTSRSPYLDTDLEADFVDDFGHASSNTGTKPNGSTTSNSITLLKRELAASASSKSVHKLTRMGFPSTGPSGAVGGTPNSPSSISAASSTRSGIGRPKFGGIKSLVQSLKSK